MSNRRDAFIIERTETGERLDTYLKHHYPVVSRGMLRRLIEEGHIQVDGRKVKPTHTPRKGQVVDVYWPPARESEIKPRAIPLEVLFEDKDLIVINKPAGLVVHQASGSEEETVVNALLHHCKGTLSGIGGVERPGIVHRLDKDTSGCLVAAKNDATHEALSNQFRDRTVEKTYLAIVHGVPARPEGDIRAAIARHPSHRKSMAVTDHGGREAWTSYKVTRILRESALVEIRLHTGRTHQIRVHFKHLGHPLVGDTTYGKRHVARFKETTGYTPPRFLLHAHKLAFIHPRTKRRRLFKAPVPEDFLEAMAVLRVDSKAATPA